MPETLRLRHEMRNHFTAGGWWASEAWKPRQASQQEVQAGRWSALIRAPDSSRVTSQRDPRSSRFQHAFCLCLIFEALLLSNNFSCHPAIKNCGIATP